MKNILLAVFILPSICLSQTKISGTVTYFYNDYQGNKADVGAGVYIVDSSLHNDINYNAIDSIIEGEGIYARYTQSKKIQESNKEISKSFWIGKKLKQQLQTKIPEDVSKDALSYGVDSETGFHKLDSLALRSTLLFIHSPDFKSRADGIGNYSINVKKPGIYYVLLQSANRTGIGMNTVTGKLYLEKVEIDEGDEKNVSYNFSLY